jgi:hypothetical protein
MSGEILVNLQTALVYTLLACTAAAVHRVLLYTHTGTACHCFGSLVLIYMGVIVGVLACMS